MARLLSVIIGMIMGSAAFAVDPAVVAVSPANGASGVSVSTQVTVTFNVNMNAATINSSTFELRSNGNNTVAASVHYDPVLKTATLTPLSPLANATSYKVTVSGGNNGVKDAAGNKMKGNFQSSFTTIGAPDLTAPGIKLVEPENGSTGVHLNAVVSAKFTEDMDPGTISAATFELRNSANQIIPATVTYHEPSRKAHLTPLGGLINSVVYTATIKGGSSGVKDLAGNPLTADYSWSFSTPFNIFQPTDAPVNPVIIDQPVEVGVKFTTTTNGKILGLRFYKGVGNDGTHTGHLWTATGTMIAEAVFINESASGWQQVLFTAPVAISSGQTYIASYYSSLGKYGFTNGYFVNSVVSGPIRALADGESGGNGVYSYSTAAAFPTNSFNATNYFVDVVFVPNGENDRIGHNNSAAIQEAVGIDQRKRISIAEAFEIKAIPNPSVDNFNMYFKGSNVNPVSVRVTDLSGRLVEMHEKVGSTSIIGLGQNWKIGIYFAEVTQGNQRRVVKLIKTN